MEAMDQTTEPKFRWFFYSSTPKFFVAREEGAALPPISFLEGQ